MRIVTRGALLALFSIGVASYYAEADVLCAKLPGGQLHVRIACLPRGEVQINPATLGFVGPAGPTGPAGPVGPAGPAGPAGGTNASFAFSGPVNQSTELSFYEKIIDKPLSPGNYVVIATASAVGSALRPAEGSVGNDELSMSTDCQLRNAAQSVIGASRSSGGYSEFTRDAHQITVIAGIHVPEGTTGSVLLYCRDAFGGVELDGAAMMVIQIGGFF